MSKIPARFLGIDDVVADVENTSQEVSSIFVPSYAPNYVNVVTVKKDGTGDYASVEAAVVALGAGGSRYRRNLIQVFEGVYTEINWSVPDYCDIEGVGRLGTVWLKGYLPPSSSTDDIKFGETMWVNRTSKLSNLKITCQNMRYPIHSDSTASAFKAWQIFDNCYVEHLGNHEARQWQTDNGGNPLDVWKWEHAFGCGTHSGQLIQSYNTRWVSATSPFYFHTNKSFDEPCIIEVVGGEINCTTEDGNAIVIQSLGSGTADKLTVLNTRVNGTVRLQDSPWLAERMRDQAADRMEVKVEISGCGKIAYNATQTNQVLQLRAADGVGSSVEVSGEGADILFGKVPDYRAGSVGYRGRVYSSHSILVGVALGVSLADRLGDLTSSPITMTALFDGVTSETITLNEDYTGRTNGNIVAALNTILLTAGSAFIVSNAFDGKAPVSIPDFEVTVTNTGSTAILAGMGAVYDGSKYKCRIATQADSVSLFAGIAIDDIIVGGTGKISFGAVYGTMLLTDSALTTVFNETVQISAVDGLFESGTTKPVLKCIMSKGVYDVIS